MQLPIFLGASPLQINADKYVELFCTLTISNIAHWSFYINAVSLPAGVFATSEFDSDGATLSGISVMGEAAYAKVVSYNYDINSFKIEALGSESKYRHIDLDVSLQGVQFTDLAELTSNCVFYQGYGTTPATLGRISVTDGLARFKINAQELLDNNGRVFLECTFQALLDFPLTVYDHITQRVVSADTVHMGNVRLTFGDGVQTHWMAADAVDAAGVQPTLPFTVSVDKLFSSSNSQVYNEPHFIFETNQYSINYPSGKDSLDLTCSTGTMIGSRSGSASRSALTLAPVKGDTAICSGAVAVTPFANPPADNSVAIFTMGM